MPASPQIHRMKVYERADFDDLLCHTVTLSSSTHQCAVSLPLVAGQLPLAFSTRVWLVRVCQLHLDGPTKRFSCIQFLYLSSCINVLTYPECTLVLTMSLWCCFLSRDCGGSGKRKSGKDMNSFYSQDSRENLRDSP